MEAEVMENIHLKTALVSVVIEPKTQNMPPFLGSVFRGWLGAALRCGKEICNHECPDAAYCPYAMIFKEKIDIKPYSILAFEDQGRVYGHIKLFGDKIAFAPEFVNRISSFGATGSFYRSGYHLHEMNASMIHFPLAEEKERLKIRFITPAALVRNGSPVMLPDLHTLVISSIRAFNRVAKYYDPANYPLHLKDDMATINAPVSGFDISTHHTLHMGMKKKAIPLSGTIGWIEYDTSSIPSGIGNILKAGEVLQIGKHTTYGFGGFLSRWENG